MIDNCINQLPPPRGPCILFGARPPWLPRARRSSREGGCVAFYFSVGAYPGYSFPRGLRRALMSIFCDRFSSALTSLSPPFFARTCLHSAGSLYFVLICDHLDGTKEREDDADDADCDERDSREDRVLREIAKYKLPSSYREDRGHCGESEENPHNHHMQTELALGLPLPPSRHEASLAGPESSISLPLD